jgi:hypothetical protein
MQQLYTISFEGVTGCISANRFPIHLYLICFRLSIYVQGERDCCEDGRQIDRYSFRVYHLLQHNILYSRDKTEIEILKKLSK